MLDVRRIQILREVAARGSMTAAAQSLSYTPSAVSQQVAKLERELGTRLVERGPRAIRLTQAGRLLAGQAGPILESLARVEAEVRAVGTVEQDGMRVSSFPSAAVALIPAAISAFRDRYPETDLNISVTDAAPSVVFEKLNRGECDLGLVFEFDFDRLPRAPTIATELVLEEPVLLAIPADHPLADRPAIALRELADEAWVRSTSKASCHAFTVKACRAAGFDPRFAAEVDDYQAMQHLIAKRVGVGLLPETAMLDLHTNVVAKRIEFPELHRRIYAAFRSTGAPSETTAGMLHALDEAARALGSKRTLSVAV